MALTVASMVTGFVSVDFPKEGMPRQPPIDVALCGDENYIEPVASAPGKPLRKRAENPLVEVATHDEVQLRDLSDRWGTLQFLLKTAVGSEVALEAIQSDVMRLNTFLEELSNAASRLSLRRGAVVRCCTPLDENAVVGLHAGNPQITDVDGTMLLNQGMTQEELQRTIADVSLLRNVIRIKVNDDGDIDTASSALKELSFFFADLNRLAAAKADTTAYDLLLRLEALPPPPSAQPSRKPRRRHTLSYKVKASTASRISRERQGVRQCLKKHGEHHKA